MREFGIFLLFVVGLLLGGIIGYSVGTINMQEEAIAHNVATWQKIDTDADKFIQNGTGDPSQLIKRQEYDYEFRWLQPGE